MALLARGAAGSALPWLYGIARHAAADRGRSRRRSPERAEEAGALEELAARLIDPAPGPRELLESARRAAAVRRAIDALPPRHRTVLLLREVDELRYDELAAALGCPIGTVESRLHRAREALAARLARLARRGELG